MKQIIVNVSGLTTEEKQRVNEALAKIKGVHKLPAINPEAGWFFAPDSSGSMMVTWSFPYEPETPTHTHQQVLEMAGMAKQGHIHSENMALYAEDAKKTDKPWELWQIKAGSSDWISCKFSPAWDPCCQFRRKPKTHTVNGVEVPDLRIVPCDDQYFYKPEPYARALVALTTLTRKSRSGEDMIKHNLCYEYTKEGKQAAILHAKAWLGIA